MRNIIKHMSVWLYYAISLPIFIKYVYDLLQVDSYSVFYDNGGFGQTEMQSRLQSAGITTVFITGLARDYCVYWSAKDALKLGTSG